jgi:molybdopterin converting factor small subunit
MKDSSTPDVKVCNIIVKYTGMFQKITKREEEIVSLNSKKTLEDLLSRLSIQYGNEFTESIETMSMIFLNGLDIGSGQLDGVKTLLMDGDVVTLVVTPLPVAGG